MRRYAPLLLWVWMAGCSVVHIPEPFGDAAAPLDPAEWNGTWCEAESLELLPGGHALTPDPSTCITVTVVDPPGGLADVVDGDHTPHRAWFRTVGGEQAVLFVSLEGEHGYELWFRLRRVSRAIVAWPVRPQGFATGIEAGALAGRTETRPSAGDDVFVEPLGAAATQAIAADERWSYFEWKEPGVLVRVSDGS